MGFFDAPFYIEGEAGIDFGGNAAGDDFQNFDAEIDEEFIDGQGHPLRLSFSFLAKSDRILDEELIFRQACRFENERWVGGCIGRLKFFDLFDLSSVGDNRGPLL